MFYIPLDTLLGGLNGSGRVEDGNAQFIKSDESPMSPRCPSQYRDLWSQIVLLVSYNLIELFLVPVLTPLVLNSIAPRSTGRRLPLIASELGLCAPVCSSIAPLKVDGATPCQ